LSIFTGVNAVPLELEPRRALGEGCCADVSLALPPERVAALGQLMKALADPVRLQIVDVLRRHAGEVCVCDLERLFPVSQPTLSHHLRKLREAGIVAVERREQWAYYYVLPDALKELSTWLR
jgi:ArsR family transcriptional regulator, arsenate/arsenite/antimonite-responsive transcriptional repressor